MYKKFTCVTLGCLLCTSLLQAKTVAEKEARAVAQNWAYQKKGKSFAVKKVTGSDRFLETSAGSDATMYLVRLEPQGWVLVAADDRADPILAYSFEETFDETREMPPSVRWIIGGYDKQITKAREEGGPHAQEGFQAHWDRLKKDHKEFIEETNQALLTRTSAIRPRSTPPGWQWPTDYKANMVRTTWGQCRYYNADTPYDTDANAYDGPLCTHANHVPTGCVATALAQIMRFHQWPESTLDYQSYDDTDKMRDNNNNPIYSPAYGSIDNMPSYYDYTSMPEGSLTFYSSDVSRLMRNIGVAVEMDYGLSGSGTTGDEALHGLVNSFPYRADERVRVRTDYPNAGEWSTKLIQNLRQGFPVYYGGGDGTPAGGHAFLLTGFDTDGSTEFYVNFGWNGNYDGWYTIDNISTPVGSFNQDQTAIFHIKPHNDNYKDLYEHDDTSGTASYLRVGGSQSGHSIDPATDSDWITTYNYTAGDVTIEITNGSGDGDTRMWLYDYQGNQLAYDDDGGTNRLSKITYPLDRGRFYIKIDENGNDSTISDYTVTISR